MNKIKGLWDKSDYNQDLDFINFRIDDFWLDEKLDELYPGNLYKGLIPTLDFCLDRQAEKEIVWKRIIPEENQIEICPILMCPDDCDFSCTLIVAEIQNYGTFIQWNKLGIDETKEWDAEMVGTKVNWFKDFPVLNFEKTEYLKMVETFKAEFEKQKITENNENKTKNNH